MGVKLAYPGREYLYLKEADLKNIEKYLSLEKRHLIHLDFEPDEIKTDLVFSIFPDTKRFIVSDYIKDFNYIFKKKRDKKYYVENRSCKDIISFFRKNNKILLNFINMKKEVRDIFLGPLLKNTLKNVEVIKVNEDMLEDIWIHVRYWNGNIIIEDNDE